MTKAINVLNVQSTIQMMRALSLSTNADDLAQVFARYLRDTTSVNRGLVIHRRDLASSHYRVELCADWDAQMGRFTESHPDTVRQGGLLGKLLEGGELRIISKLSAPPDDPAQDLLDGYKALMAFPIFKEGHATGTMILLCRESWAIHSPGLCELALMGGLLDRAIHTQTLAQQLEESCSALDRELSAAAEVQRWLLPGNLPTVEGLSLAASYRTARRSGGDYYDVLQLPGGNLGLLIADVSGKGAPAAVLTAVVRTIVHSGPPVWNSPAALLHALNVKLCELNLADRGAFVTAFCAIVDPGTGRLIYSSAGHPPPRLVRAVHPKLIELDAACSIPLGLVKDIPYFDERMLLSPSDTMVLYTDGIMEARSAQRELFGLHRLDFAVREASLLDPQELVQGILRDVEKFSGGAALADDQTLVVLQINKVLQMQNSRTLIPIQERF